MTPVRLDKQPEKKHHFDTANFFCNNDLKTKVEAWCIKHASPCMLISIIVFLLAFVVLCSALCGVSALESGGMRNFMNGGYL